MSSVGLLWFSFLVQARRIKLSLGFYIFGIRITCLDQRSLPHLTKISVFGIGCCHLKPAILSRHLLWSESCRRICLGYNVHVSQVYRSTVTTATLYTVTFVTKLASWESQSLRSSFLISTTAWAMQLLILGFTEQSEEKCWTLRRRPRRPEKNLLPSILQLRVEEF